MKLFPFLPEQQEAASETIGPRKAPVAGLLSLLSPGLGQLYDGEPRRALALAATHLVGPLAIAVTWAFSMFPIAAFLVLYLLADLGVRAAAVLWAVASARRKNVELPRHPYQNAAVYFAFVVAAYLVGWGAQIGLRLNVLDTIPVGESAPAPLEAGDVVLVRKVGDSRSPRPQAMALLEPPGELIPGQPLVFARVESAGDELTARDAKGGVVGPMPRSKYLGEIVGVYWSTGSDGVRWERVGLRLR